MYISGLFLFSAYSFNSFTSNPCYHVLSSCLTSLFAMSIVQSDSGIPPTARPASRSGSRNLIITRRENEKIEGGHYSYNAAVPLVITGFTKKKKKKKKTGDISADVTCLFLRNLHTLCAMKVMTPAALRTKEDVARTRELRRT